MTAIRPRRSVLYMPASNTKVLDKARSLDADCLIFDLEDAVAPEAKDAARANALATVAAGGYGRRELIIRINGAGTPWHEEDLRAAAGCGADAVLVPKLQSAQGLSALRASLDQAGVPSCRLWAMMETPLAVLNAGEIAAAAPHDRFPLAVFVMGTNDLAKDTRALLTRDRLPMLAWLSTCVAAARAFGLDIIDGVFNDIADGDGLAAECAQGRALGMDGKTLIHPSQIAPCNAAFSPSDEDIAWARRIREAFALPENAGKGAISLDGRMVERLHADMAARTLALAEAIRAGQAA